MSNLLRRLRDPAFGTETSERNLMNQAAAEIERLSEANTQVWADNERLRAALDTVRASGLLIGSTTLHDRVRSAVYNAIDANPAAMKEPPHDR